MIELAWLNKLHWRFKYAWNLGLGSTTVCFLQKIRQSIGRQTRPYKLLCKYIKHPLLCRPGTSDRKVFLQIFADRDYQCLDEVQSAQLVIDCGANVGYSSVYFLNRFPSAKVIAIEPDPNNFALLKANVAPYGDRCETLQTAVWSSETDLVISEVPFRDGREWSKTVRPIRTGETGSMRAISIGSVLKESGLQRISILKCDIEGAEIQVFSSGFESWLGKVDNLVIELHGDEARAIFLRAISHEGFQTSESGELFVCRRATSIP
ncbi:MAG: FkbM family methyltransferase [Verrucomicrobia bacterium]|nr:FkbM family methyltransferase [Verrucomicrobiota bacterium]